MSDKLYLARRIVQIERGLKRLPKPDHAAAVDLSKRLRVHELRERWRNLDAGGEPTPDPDPEQPVEQQPVDAASGATEAAEPKTKTFRRFFAQGCPVDLYSTPDGVHYRYSANEKRFYKVSRRTPIAKRMPHGRIIRTIPLGDGRQAVLHATRGWRTERV